MATYGYGYPPPPAPPAQRNGCGRPACLGCLTALLVACCLLSASVVVLWPIIRTTVSEQIGGLAISALDEAAAAEGLPTDPISELVAAVPPGEYVIDLMQLRTALSSAGLPGAEGLSFVDNRLVLPLDALGMPGTFSTAIGASAGRLIFIDPRIDGPMSVMVDPAGLIEPLLLRLNETIMLEERSIEQAFIDGDRLVLEFR